MTFSPLRFGMILLATVPCLAVACSDDDAGDDDGTDAGTSSGERAGSSGNGTSSGAQSSSGASSGASGSSGASSSGASSTSSSGASGTSSGELDASTDDASASDANTCAATTESCDGLLDENCNGTVDEGCGRCPLLQQACAGGCCPIDRYQLSASRSQNGSSIAVDSVGNIFFAYTLPNSGSWASWLAVYHAVPGTWTQIPLGGGQYRNRVRVDAQDRVHIAYGSFTGNYMIEYIRSDDHGATFSAPVDLGATAIGGTFDLELDSQSQPHFVYTAGYPTESLVYKHLVGATWSTETLVTSTSNPRFPDLELGFADRPIVVFDAYHPPGIDGGAKRAVFYNGNRWIAENIETTPQYADSGYFVGNSTHAYQDGSFDALFTRHVAGSSDSSAMELVLAKRTPGDDGVWSQQVLSGVTNYTSPTMFFDEQGRRAAVSDGLSLQRELTPGTWTTKAIGLPGTTVAQFRRGHWLYLGYSDTSSQYAPTFTLVDLDAP